jgi:hypothetical protein
VLLGIGVTVNHRALRQVWKLHDTRTMKVDDFYDTTMVVLTTMTLWVFTRAQTNYRHTTTV